MAARKPPKRQAWSGLCPAGKHGLDFEGQRCDLCKHVPLVNQATDQLLGCTCGFKTSNEGVLVAHVAAQVSEERELAAGRRARRRRLALSVMRVKVEERPGMPQFGVLVGMLLDEHGDMQAVVRLDHFGLMLKALHPSKVVPVTPEDEEAHKP